MFIFGGLLSIIQVYRAKTVFLSHWKRFFRLNGILHHLNKNKRLKRVFPCQRLGNAIFINLCARFCFEASSSFWHSIFFVFVFVFVFVFFHAFFILFRSFLFIVVWTLIIVPMTIYLITTIIIIYKILISFVCARVCVRTHVHKDSLKQDTKKRSALTLLLS